MSVAPREPAIASRPLPAVGGAIGAAPEDFVVDELPLFAPSGQGEHLFVRVQKRLMTTPDMLHVVARAAGVRDRDIGSAGMKDKQGLTSQWISLPPGAKPPDTWELPDAVRVLESSRNERKLRTGQQAGNRFSVRLVGVGPDALSHAQAILDLLAERGLPNAFGAQRFGVGGHNLERALGWLARGAPVAGPRARFLKKLYPSVIQSEIFNRYLAARLELGADRLLAGEVVRLEGSGSVFVVEDAAREQPRLDARDIHLTGPMPGPRMKPAAGRPLELEREAIASLGLGEPELALLGKLADGTRRDLLVRPGGLEVQPEGEDALRIVFALPSGSYATQLLRELTRAPWSDPHQADAAGGAD